MAFEVAAAESRDGTEAEGVGLAENSRNRRLLSRPLHCSHSLLVFDKHLPDLSRKAALVAIKLPHVR